MTPSKLTDFFKTNASSDMYKLNETRASSAWRQLEQESRDSRQNEFCGKQSKKTITSIVSAIKANGWFRKK